MIQTSYPENRRNTLGGTMTTLKFLRKIFPVVALLLAGCASEVTRQSTTLSPVAPSPARQYLVQQSVLVRFDSGYDRTIQAGTTFLEIGALKQGKVLKPTNAVFTIEGAHVHEAYPVVNENRIVGFYLPVEQAFAQLSNPVTLSIEEKGIQK